MTQPAGVLCPPKGNQGTAGQPWEGISLSQWKVPGAAWAQSEGKMKAALWLGWGDSDGQAVLWDGIRDDTEVRVMGLG